MNPDEIKTIPHKKLTKTHKKIIATLIISQIIIAYSIKIINNRIIDIIFGIIAITILISLLYKLITDKTPDEET